MKRCVFNSFATVALLLTGCDAYKTHPPTMGADPPLTGGEGIALENELQSAFTIVDYSGDKLDPRLCLHTLPQHQESESLPYYRYAHKKDKSPPFQCIRYKANPDPKEVANHVEAGFALTDLYCDIYFRRISQHSNERRFARGVVNDVGAAITAILGLSKVSSPVTGGVGAGFGLADSSFRNYDDAFLVSADLSTLQAKVYSEQQKFRDAYGKKPPLTRYSQANSVILQYANYCSYTGMRALINSSLAQTTDDGPSAIERMATYISSAVKAAKTIQTAADGNSADAAGNTADGNQM